MSLSVNDLTIDNALLKIKILEYQREYLTKKNIENPSKEEIMRMRKAVASRLKNEINEISRKHLEITNRIYTDSTGSWR